MTLVRSVLLLLSLADFVKVVFGDRTGYHATSMPVEIPENGAYTGDYAEVGIYVTANECTIEDLNVIVKICHTWVGDVSLILVAPNGMSVGLMERPGQPDPDPLYGDSSDLYTTLTFDDQSSTSPETLGEGLSDGETILSQRVFSVGGLEGPPFPAGMYRLLDLKGLDPYGTWTLIAADHADCDTGYIEKVKLSFKLDCGECVDGQPCGK